MDAAGNVSASSASASATTLSPPDATAPSVPIGLSATGASTSQIDLSWTASTDNVGVTGYQIFRGGSQISTATATTYSDTGLTASTTYTYSVRAMDAAGNLSAPSASVSASTLAPPDTTAPTTPTNVVVAAQSSSVIRLSWNPATDNVGVVGYKIYRNASQIGTVTGTSYSDAGLSVSTSYSYAVAAYDAAGNTSAPSTSAAAVTLAQVSTVTYTTTIPFAENPISENGHWLNGGTLGLDWPDVSTTSGLAIGHSSGLGGRDDAIAILAGNWGPDQSVQGVVRTVNQNSSVDEEVSLRLRTVMSPHIVTGYEVNFRATHDGSQFVQVLKWNGARGDITEIGLTTGPGLLDGDVIKATIVGAVITV